MNSLTLSRCALSVCAAATLLVGCGGLQPAGVTQGPVAQGQMPENQSRVSGVKRPLRSVRHASVTETVLHSFSGDDTKGYPYDGAYPAAGLTYSKGTLYGTASEGGGFCHPPGCGTVYSITPSGTYTDLHSFKGTKDGAQPEARLIVRNGALYGTTRLRGGGCVRTYGCGAVFSITPSGHETVLHGFAGPPDGLYPKAPLLNVNGTLYGTTDFGGVGVNCAPQKRSRYYGDGCGTVFSITPGGTEKVLYSFHGGTDGAYPNAGLIDVNGTLYGTTSEGGGGGSAYGDGTVFSITLGGKETVLHSFAGSPADGSYPEAGLTNVNGTLYGTTFSGGALACNNLSGSCGTVFKITTAGKETVLHRFFASSSPDGVNPAAGLLNFNGTLYGTTEYSEVYGNNLGTVFSITLSGQVTVLHYFGTAHGGSGPDGAHPVSGLIDVNGTAYGTTYQGGAYDDGGTVYSITL